MKKGISQKAQDFHACSCSCSDSFIDFFFYMDAYTGFIYLEMVGSHTCTRQSAVHIKQFNFYLKHHNFSLLHGAPLAPPALLPMGPMVLVKVYGIALNAMNNT